MKKNDDPEHQKALQFVRELELHDRARAAIRQQDLVVREKCMRALIIKIIEDPDFSILLKGVMHKIERMCEDLDLPLWKTKVGSPREQAPSA